jgi:hypothetical protein
VDVRVSLADTTDLLVRLAIIAACALTAGCAAHDDAGQDSKTLAKSDASFALQPTENPTGQFGDASYDDLDGSFSSDAFFINDPAPPICGPGGDLESAATAAGSLDCPADKNREGCACEHPGEQATCWPGKRVNRNHGVCKDGKTTCRANLEFGSSWGPCEGYVLPVDGAVEGADACRCFSSGKWSLANLVPCIYRDDDKGTLEISSSRQDADKGFLCDSKPDPSSNWTSSSLNVECAGQYRLCYTLKSGDIDHPKAQDCTLAHQCIDSWYATPNQDQALPALAGWVSEDEGCAERFVDVGGYGEMSVLGTSSECDAVDNGHGQPFVFMRTRYCSSRCATTPDLAECQACGTGGSGHF